MIRKKAVDAVNHKSLFGIHYHYGIKGNVHKLFSSLLSNRKQFVALHNAKSDRIFTNCDIPRGSFLGPLLSLLYINDIYIYCNYKQNSILEYMHKQLHANDILEYILQQITHQIMTKKLRLTVSQQQNYFLLMVHALLFSIRFWSLKN